MNSENIVCVRRFPGLSSSMVQSSSSYNEELKISPLEDNVISYIAGWLAKKTLQKFNNCEKCTSTILNTAQQHLEPPSDRVLIHLKAFSCHTDEFANLHFPSEECKSVVRSQMFLFSNLFPKHSCERNIHDYIFRKLKYATNEHYEGWFATECSAHRLSMLSLLVKCKLYYAVKWVSNDLRDKSLINISNKRRTPENSTEKLNSKLRKVKHL